MQFIFAINLFFNQLTSLIISKVVDNIEVCYKCRTSKNQSKELNTMCFIINCLISLVKLSI